MVTDAFLRALEPSRIISAARLAGCPGGAFATALPSWSRRCSWSRAPGGRTVAPHAASNARDVSEAVRVDQGLFTLAEMALSALWPRQSRREKCSLATPSTRRATPSGAATGPTRRAESIFPSGGIVARSCRATTLRSRRLAGQKMDSAGPSRVALTGLGMRPSAVPRGRTAASFAEAWRGNSLRMKRSVSAASA